MPGPDLDPSAAAWAAMREFGRNLPYAPTPENRPRVLDAGPLPLTRDSSSQMSFGERAALEGVLAEVRPRIAIEIGTAEGGNLRRIAAYSQQVHSIDLDHSPLTEPPPRNVELHSGPSAAVLPALLTRMASEGEAVDLALVDGDHSFDGVRGDLEALLSSSCTARSVILVHDTMNAEVRAGVESVALDTYRQVVYYELDFVPGYIYREGVARNTAWGGLALILTDQQRDGGYAPSPRQALYHEPFAALQRLRGDLIEEDAAGAAGG